MVGLGSAQQDTPLRISAEEVSHVRGAGAAIAPRAVQDGGFGQFASSVLKSGFNPIGEAVFGVDLVSFEKDGIDGDEAQKQYFGWVYWPLAIRPIIVYRPPIISPDYVYGSYIPPYWYNPTIIQPRTSDLNSMVCFVLPVGL